MKPQYWVVMMMLKVLRMPCFFFGLIPKLQGSLQTKGNINDSYYEDELLKLPNAFLGEMLL